MNDRPEVCRNCTTFEKGCEGSNQEDCERQGRAEMKDKRTNKELTWVLEANDKTIARALSRIHLYSEEIDKAVKANLDIYMELFYRRQPSDRPKEE